MKDEHDNQTREILDIGKGQKVVEVKSKRPNSFAMAEDGHYYIPVSVVALQWSVTSRRIRALLSAGRLEGRQHDNGYWEVRYPYSYTDGMRGPASRRFQKRGQKQEQARKKPELRVV